MDSVYYSGTTLWVIAVNVTFLIAMLCLLQKGSASAVTKFVFGFFSIVWILLIHYVLSRQLFIPPDTHGAAFYIFTFFAASLVLLVFYFSSFRATFANVLQEDIQWVQGLRVFVASGFFMEGVLKVIPGWFSIMDGFLHVTSGFLALTAAIAVLKKSPAQKALLWVANIVGIADIFIIVTSINLIVWKQIGPFHNMQYVVFYTGVLLLWLHFISILKLLKSTY